jgi:hypothetical protein
MIAANQNPFVPQILAAPNALLMARSFMLATAGAAKPFQVPVVNDPCALKIPGANRGSPVVKACGRVGVAAPSLRPRKDH